MFDRVVTSFQLGLGSIVRVLLYRTLLKMGYYRIKLRVSTIGAAEIFEVSDREGFHGLEYLNNGYWVERARSVISGKRYLFQSEEPADVLFEGDRQEVYRQHWSRINDFNLGVDIKTIWDEGRFDEIRILVMAFLATGEWSYLNYANSKVSLFFLVNPVNAGPQWKCGLSQTNTSMYAFSYHGKVGEDKIK